MLYCIVLCCTVLYCVIMYCVLSHALKNTVNQRPGLPLHILRYATGNMQRVVFHSTFPSLLARNSLLRSFCELLKNQLRSFSTPANHYEYFRSRPEIFDDFRTLPNISEDCQRFSKIYINRSSSPKTGLKRFQSFRNFPEISELFRKFT